MNQTTKLLLQKGVSSINERNTDSIFELDLKKMDSLIEVAVMEWVQAHPEDIEKFNDKHYTRGLFKNSKVIYL